MMKFKDSRDSVNSELLLWKESTTQVSVKDVFDLKVHPISSVYNEGSIHFDIPSQSRGMLSNIDIISTFKVMKGTSKLEDNDNCSIVNNISNALWEMVQVELGDRVSIMQSMRNSYAYQTFFNYCFTSDPNRSSYLFATELFKLDSGNTKDDSETMVFDGDGIKNRGAADRAKKIHGSKPVTVRSRLNVPLFSTSKALPTNMKIRISLSRNNDQFLVLADQDAGYRVDIEDVYLNVTYIRPHDVFLSMIEERLAKQPAPFFVSRPELIIKPISHAGRNIRLNNLFPGQLHSLAFFCIQRSQDFQGDYSKNPFTFLPFSKFQLTVDGVPYFSSPLEIEPETVAGKRYYTENRAFLEQLYRTTGHHVRGCNLINTENFQQNFIVGVSLAGDRAPSSAAYLNPRQEASTQLEIDIGYSVNVSDELILLIYAVYNRLITISSDRSVQVFD